MAKNDFDNFVASIDIGNDNIVVLIAEKIKNKFKIIDAVSKPSAGIKNNNIYSFADLSDVITLIIEEISNNINAEISTLFVNYIGNDIQCLNSSGKTAVKEEVTQKEINNAISSAKAITKEGNKEVLHEINKKFIIDEMQFIDNPINLKASVLEAHIHIVLVDSSVIRNIENIMNKNNLDIDKILVDSIAMSSVLLTEEEKNQGVCLIDFGANTTKLSIFKDGCIFYNNILDIGCNIVTEDISFAFDTSFEQARKLKHNYGCAKADNIIDECLLEFRQKVDNSTHYLSNLMLAEIIQDSYLKILSAIKNDINDKKIINNLKAGFVLSGGGAQIQACEALVRSFFSKRAKIGLINNSIISGLSTIVNDYRYSCAIGLLVFQDTLVEDIQIVKTNKIFNKGIRSIKSAF